MASKKDMPCNKPRRSTRPGKKMMVKGCEGGKEKLIHFGAKGYGHNYSAAARRVSRLDISALVPRLSLRLGTGPVRSYGLVREDLRRAHLKVGVGSIK